MATIGGVVITSIQGVQIGRFSGWLVIGFWLRMTWYAVFDVSNHLGRSYQHQIQTHSNHSTPEKTEDEYEVGARVVVDMGIGWQKVDYNGSQKCHRNDGAPTATNTQEENGNQYRDQSQTQNPAGIQKPEKIIVC